MIAVGVCVSNGRNRTGYESGLSLIYKVKSAAEFILADKPTEMLSQFSKLSLVGEDALVQPSAKSTKEEGEESDEEQGEDAELGPSVDLNEHPATTQEIRALVEDLRVLGKKEFKLLMKWCVFSPSHPTGDGSAVWLTSRAHPRL